MKILVADLYTANGEQRILDAGGSSAGDLFSHAIRVHRPDVEISVLHFRSSDAAPPEPLDAYDGVLWSGSNLNIHKRHNLIEAQIDLSRTLFDKGVPQFGCCFGTQIGALAAGAAVVANPKGMELAWARDVSLTAAGATHPMYVGKAASFDAFCWHNNIIQDLPSGSVLLASNRIADVQGIVLKRNRGEFWGTQYHLEFTAGEVTSMISVFGDSLVEAGVCDTAGIAKLREELNSVRRLEGDAALPARMAPVLDPAIRTAELGNWLRRIEAN